MAENVDDVPAVVEPKLAQQLIQARVERVTRGRFEICCRDPQARLSLTLTLPIAMERIVVRGVTVGTPVVRLERL